MQTTTSTDSVIYDQFWPFPKFNVESTIVESPVVLEQQPEEKVEVVTKRKCKIKREYLFEDALL